jgi:hypothetical protein
MRLLRRSSSQRQMKTINEIASSFLLAKTNAILLLQTLLCRYKRYSVIASVARQFQIAHPKAL